MKKLIVVILFNLLAINLFAQTDLEQRIQEARKSSEDVVQINRDIIIEHLNNENYKNLLAIVDQTNAQIDTSKVTAFYTWEVQILSILEGNLDRFYKLTKNFPSIYQSIGSEYDNLGYTAISRINENEEYWKKWYDQQTGSEEDLMILRIFFGSIGLYADNVENKHIAKEFRKKYPNSSYMDFVDLRAALFSTGSWDWYVGYGNIALQGDVSDITKPGSSFLMGTSGYINQLFISVFFMTGLSDIRKNIQGITPETGPDFDINEGDDLRYVNIGAKFGWLLYKKSFIKIVPFASISSLSINIPPQTDRNTEPHALNASTGFGAGLLADFDIFSWNSKPQYGKSTSSHLGFRTSASYIKYVASDDYVGGSGLSAEVSFIWWIGD